MANKKFTDLTSVSSVGNDDILAVTIDPTGTPASRKVAVDVLMANAPVQSVAGQTGVVTLANTDISGLGTASTQDVGTADGNVVQLDATGLPAVDGSQLTNVSGTDSTKLAIANNLSDLADAATARTNLGVDAAGADNSTDVTLDTTNHDYLSLTGQTVSLGAIDLSTDVTGLLPNTSVSGLGSAATTASSDYATAAQGTAADSAVQPTDSIDVLSDVDTSTVVPSDGQALVWDNSNGKWEPGPAGAQNLSDLNDVTITSVTAEQFIKYDGSGFVNGSIDVDTPVNTAIRGTAQPHIGAYPEQSFRVTDNPNKSVMVIADADGNLEFLTKDGANVFVNTPSSRLALAKGFSVQEDGDEPDVEVVATSGATFSVISGDSDTKGANGLPIRQGFNFPDIGANPAPILISGGTIA